MKNVSPTTRFILIVEFIVAIYMLIALTTSEYESFRVERYIEEFEQRNQEIAVENTELKDQYEYFTSPEYQEKIAKQNFGLVRPGEEVLIIPESSTVSDEEEYQNKLISERERFYRDLNVPLKWWYFFFGDV